MRVDRMRLLGGFSLESDGATVPLPLAAQRLLARLALYGRASRLHLGATLWPDLTEPRALACLRTLIWRIRKVAPDLLTAGGVDLALSPGVSVDVQDVAVLAYRFQGLARDVSQQVDVSEIRSGGPSLCGGALLPGWYEDWVITERGRLEQMRLHALESCAAWLLRAGETQLALELALEAVRCEPLRESATATLISVHVAEGNVWDAVQEYEAFRRSLLDELGVPPSERLAALLPARWRALHDLEDSSPLAEAGAGEGSRSPSGIVPPPRSPIQGAYLRRRPPGRAVGSH